VSVRMLEPLLVSWKGKGHEVSTRFGVGIYSGTENFNRGRQQPMGSGFATSASTTGCTACGCWRVLARRPATLVQVASQPALSKESSYPSRSGGSGQEWKIHGCGRRVGWRWSWMQSQKGVGLVGGKCRDSKTCPSPY